MIALLIFLFLLTSCLKTEVIQAPMKRVQKDTIQHDTTMIDIVVDTTTNEIQIPIVFNPSVEDWEDEQEINF